MHRTGSVGKKLERLGTSATCSMITMSVTASIAVSKIRVILYQTSIDNQKMVVLGYLIILTNSRL